MGRPLNERFAENLASAQTKKTGVCGIQLLPRLPVSVSSPSSIGRAWSSIVRSGTVAKVREQCGGGGHRLVQLVVSYTLHF